MTIRVLALFAAVAGVGVAAPAVAIDVKDEIEVTAGAVTALSCAIEAQKTKDLTLLGSACPMSEVKSGLVIVDVAELEIYQPSTKKIAKHELESAFGGGSVDFEGVVVKVDKKTGLAVVDVNEYSVAKKKKAGGFKGCL
jgi:hypothetical protein